MSVEEITYKVKFQNNFAIILFTAVHLSQLKIRISIRKSKTWRKFRIKNNSSIPFISLSRRNFVEGGKGGCSHYLNFATLEVISYNARSEEYKLCNTESRYILLTLNCIDYNHAANDRNVNRNSRMNVYKKQKSKIGIAFLP